MKGKNVSDIMLYLIKHLLLGGLAISFIAGIVILPNLLARIGTGSWSHSAVWLNKSISLILIAGWLFTLAILALSSIAVKEVENIRVAQRSLEISVEVLQMNLERMKNGQGQKLLQQTHDDHREENDPAVTYGPAGSFIGKSDS